MDPFLSLVFFLCSCSYTPMNSLTSSPRDCRVWSHTETLQTARTPNSWPSRLTIRPRRRWRDPPVTREIGWGLPNPFLFVSSERVPDWCWVHPPLWSMDGVVSTESPYVQRRGRLWVSRRESGTSGFRDYGGRPMWRAVNVFRSCSSWVFVPLF